MPTEAGGFDALLSAFDRFHKTLDATTVPAEGGGRKVAGYLHAIELSEATDALYTELSLAYLRLLRQHGRTVAGDPPGVQLQQSDSPDGPWKPIPAGSVTVTMMGIGGKGADAGLLAAMDSAMQVAGFPPDKWNTMQAAAPGADHHRFHAGEMVSAADLAVLESAAKLLRLKAPPAPPTVSVSPELLDREQSAESIDPHTTSANPTTGDLVAEVGISTDTFGRVRKAAKIEVKLRGAAARDRRYTPSEVDRLIDAALAGPFLERQAMARKWARWGSNKAASKPHDRK